MKSRSRPQPLFLSLAACAFSAFVATEAAALTLLSDDRYVRTIRDYEVGSPFPDEDVTTTPTVPFGPFDAGDLGTQTSELLLTQEPGVRDTLTGDVSASSFLTFQQGDLILGISVFSIQFEIVGFGAYSLSGLLDALDTDSFGSRVELFGPSGTIYSKFPDYDSDTDENSTTPFSTAGTLAPGVYELRAEPSAARFYGYLDLEFTIVDNVVPEPSTAILLGAGVIALAGARRRARDAS